MYYFYYHQAKAWKKKLPKYIQPPKTATFCRHTEAKSLQLYTAVHYFSRWLKKFIVYKQKKINYNPSLLM